jgi:hypothetical protein
MDINNIAQQARIMPVEQSSYIYHISNTDKGNSAPWTTTIAYGFHCPVRGKIHPIVIIAYFIISPTRSSFCGAVDLLHKFYVLAYNKPIVMS